jgi:hypothetical protein
MLAIMLIPYAAALLFVAADLRGAFARTPMPTPGLPAWFWVMTSVGLYAGQTMISWWASTHQLHSPVAAHWLPIPVVYVGSQANDVLSVIVVLVGAAQAYALLGLYRSNPSRPVLVAGFSVMAAIALASPSLTSFDAYGYVHNALLGILSYAPPPTPFPGEYHVFDLWFGRPTSTLYGPLWLPIVRMITILAPTLTSKLIALRIANLVFFAALLALLRALGQSRRMIAIVALNPAIFFQFVANAHNDIIGVIVLLAAAALVAKQRPIATGLVSVAGLIKLPFVVLGLPLFSNVGPPSRRLALCGIAVVATLAFSWLGGGEPYARSLMEFGIHAGPWRYWHLPALLAAAAFLTIAIAGGRRYRSAVWLIPSIGTFGIAVIYPWYFLWSFVYALPRRRVLRHLLVGFPLAAALVQPEFWSPITLFVIFPLLTAALCAPLLRLTQRAAA